MAKIFVKIAYCVFGPILGDYVDDASLLQAKKMKHHTFRTNTLPGSYCLATGDPHIKPFDESGEKEECLGPMGDYVLVSNANLWVHARYLDYERDGGYAFVKGLVIGGPRFGGKKFSVPVLNDADGHVVTFDGQPIPEAGLTVTAVSGDPNLALRIWKAPGPKLDGFAIEDIMDTSWADTYWIALFNQATSLEWGHEDILIMINHGTHQHVLISGNKAALEGSAGQCGNDNGDPSDDKIQVDACGDKAPTCEFPVCPNPEDDTPRVPATCVNGTEQFEFYTKICKAYWGKKIQKAEWKLFNCVTDCCGDRDSCPDLGQEGKYGTCLVKGDPHIKTFDSPTVEKHVYVLNDYWLVNSKYLQVQGRYGTQRRDGKGQLMGVAVSGLLTGGVKVYIPRGTEPTQIDGSPMSGNAYHSTAFDIVYDSHGEDLNFKLDATGHTRKQKPIFTLTFKNPTDGKMVATLQVGTSKNSYNYLQTFFFRAENWILKGVTGQCGNFNGNKADDGDELDAKFDVVSDDASLFPDANPQKGLVFNQAPCTRAQKNIAVVCCKERHSPTTADVINSCVIDHCCANEDGCDPATECKKDN